MPVVGQLGLGEAVAMAVGHPRQRLHSHVEVQIRLTAMLEGPGIVFPGPLLALGFALTGQAFSWPGYVTSR
jgi:hypothetical protein